MITMNIMENTSFPSLLSLLLDVDVMVIFIKSLPNNAVLYSATQQFKRKYTRNG